MEPLQEPLELSGGEESVLADNSHITEQRRATRRVHLVRGEGRDLSG